jgi:thioredoxin reductase (NADPH)
MVTADEIAAVSIFAVLTPVECERLARIVADIRVGPGEYVVHAGDERALFAVLEGHVETSSARCRSRSGRRSRSGSGRRSPPG